MRKQMYEKISTFNGPLKLTADFPPENQDKMAWLQVSQKAVGLQRTYPYGLSRL